MDKEVVKQQLLTGERALFAGNNLRVEDSVFDDGESPLKESSDIEVVNCGFKWKYPLWYCHNVTVRDSYFFEMGRAGIWYTDDIDMKDVIFEAPKSFRRCRRVNLSGVEFVNAEETMWSCEDVTMSNVVARGDYFAMNSCNMKIEDFRLVGNYPFDGSRNLEVRNSRLISKDAFWNTDNVTVYDSYISGEYIGWNSRNLTFVNCTIESLQGLCYIDNLVMKNCKLINTTLAFEYSTVDADITSKIDSVINPTSGTITANSIDTLIIEKDRVNPELTKIVCRA